MKPRGAGQAPSRGSPSRLAGRLGSRSPAAAHGRTSLRGPAPLLPAAAVPTPCPPSRGWLPDGGRLPPTPRAAPDGQPPRGGPPGAAPLPPLPAAAAALTSERTRHGRTSTALTLSGERTNTLEATASPPPLQRRPLLRTRTQAPPPSARGMRARHAGKESFLDARSSAPPPAGGELGAGVRALVQPSSAGKPLGSPPRLLPVRSSFGQTWCQPGLALSPRPAGDSLPLGFQARPPRCRMRTGQLCVRPQTKSCT